MTTTKRYKSTEATVTLTTRDRQEIGAAMPFRLSGKTNGNTRKIVFPTYTGESMVAEYFLIKLRGKPIVRGRLRQKLVVVRGIQPIFQANALKIIEK